MIRFALFDLDFQLVRTMPRHQPSINSIPIPKHQGRVHLRFRFWLVPLFFVLMKERELRHGTLLKAQPFQVGTLGPIRGQCRTWCDWLAIAQCGKDWFGCRVSRKFGSPNFVAFGCHPYDAIGAGIAGASGVVIHVMLASFFAFFLLRTYKKDLE